MKSENKKQSTIYYMIGIPASGKSTYAEKLRGEKKIPSLSSDAIRKELTGNEADVDTVAHEEIFRELQKRAFQLVRAGKDFIWDATGIDPKYRRVDLEVFKKHGAIIEGVLFVTPKEVALERNLKRQRTVPLEIIESMYDFIVKDPIDTELDAFDRISIVGKNGEVMSVYDRERAKEQNIEVKISPREFTPRSKFK